jgi:hypothetical protein
MAQSKQKGMIFLDPGNQIIEETMRTKMEYVFQFTNFGSQLHALTVYACIRNKAEPVDIRISDFDGMVI